MENGIHLADNRVNPYIMCHSNDASALVQTQPVKCWRGAKNDESDKERKPGSTHYARRSLSDYLRRVCRLFVYAHHQWLPSSVASIGFRLGAHGRVDRHLDSRPLVAKPVKLFTHSECPPISGR